jgi:hypothetical protein
LGNELGNDNCFSGSENPKSES